MRKLFCSVQEQLLSVISAVCWNSNGMCVYVSEMLWLVTYQESINCTRMCCELTRWQEMSSKLTSKM